MDIAIVCQADKTRERWVVELFYNRTCFAFHPTAGEWVVMGGGSEDVPWGFGGAATQLQKLGGLSLAGAGGLFAGRLKWPRPA